MAHKKKIETQAQGQESGKAEVDAAALKTALEELVTAAARSHNTLTSDEVNAKLAPFDLSDEKTDAINAYLEARNIDVLDMDDQDDDKAEDEFDEDSGEDNIGDELSMIENREKEEDAEDVNDDLSDTSDYANTADPVRMYLKEIGRVRLLNADEEIEIAKRIENGSIADSLLEGEFKDVPRGDQTKAVTAEMLKALPQVDEIYDEKKDVFIGLHRNDLENTSADGRDAKNELAEANLRLVVSIAKKYVGRGLTFLDLIQEGNLGLMKAVEKFDFRKGFKFSTYATWWIRQAITRAIADQARTIRIPVHMVETINKFVRTTRTLTTKLGREPTDEEVAKEMGISEEKVSEIKQIAVEPVSLDTPVGDEEDSQIGDFVSDDKAVGPADAATFSSLKDQLKQSMESLTKREQDVLRLRFGLDDGRARTLEEVGKEFGVTRERIRQIEAKALRKLRHPSRAKKLKDYLD